MRLYLRKNDLSKNPKIPYFTLLVPPEKGSGQDWKEVGVFWKAESGKGYNGFTGDDVMLDVSKVKSWKEKQAAQSGEAFDGVDIEPPSND